MPSSLLQVVNSLFQTCYNNWEQTVRTQIVDSLWTDLYNNFLQTCNNLMYVFTYVGQRQLSIRVMYKGHTDRTRFGNARRIFSFQWHLTLIFFSVFQIFGTTWTNLSYFVCISCKIFTRWRFICFWKLKIRVALPNRARSVWALRVIYIHSCIDNSNA
jgi:hypothetical protein